MAEVVQLPGFTPEMLRVLRLLAVSPHGMKANMVYLNTEISPQATRRALGRLVALKWVVRDEHKVFRAVGDGLGLAEFWQVVQDLKLEATLTDLPLPVSAEPVKVRVLRLRQELRLSQSAFAAALREAGDKLGRPNGCTKRLVQKWESGEHAAMRDHYEQALALLGGRIEPYRAGRRSTRPVVVRRNPMMDGTWPGGTVSAGWWMGSPLALTELADRLGRAGAELARIRQDLTQLSRASDVGR